MSIDWINIVSTFGAAIAGSWFGARATHHQTKMNLAHAQAQWKRERAFELIGVVDEYVNYSFRKDTLSLPDRDNLSRKLHALCSIVLPEDAARVRQNFSSVRKLHIGQECKTTFPETEKLFSELRDKLIHISQIKDI
jgi:hypothetical protein